MDYRHFGNSYVLRIDKGEDIISVLKDFCKAQQIKLGTVTAIGAVNDIEIGLFNTAEKKYYANTYREDMEITSFLGNISTMDGETYMHIHGAFSNITNETRGGHVNRAIVGATCELVITAIEGEIDRKFNDEIGLNLIEFK